MEAADSTQLVKCRVTNKHQDESFRLIESSNFDLWRYLVVNKHHITVHQSSLCLWVNQSEYGAKQEIYSRAGLVEPACRITLLTFDEVESDYTSVRRYTLANNATTVEQILILHLSNTARDRADFTLDRETGFAITTDPTASHRPTTSLHSLPSQSDVG